MDALPLPDTAQSADEWYSIARFALSDGEYLLDGMRFQTAYGQAGFAVEAALKGRIMMVKGLNRWPTKGPYLTHDLVALLHHAGLTGWLDEQMALNSPFYKQWLVIKDWSITTRYIGAGFPAERAKDMVMAVKEGGMLECLITSPR